MTHTSSFSHFLHSSGLSFLSSLPWFHVLQLLQFPLQRCISRMVIPISQYEYESHERKLMVYSSLVHSPINPNHSTPTLFRHLCPRFSLCIQASDSSFNFKFKSRRALKQDKTPTSFAYPCSLRASFKSIIHLL